MVNLVCLVSTLFNPWVVYYGPALAARDFKPYDLIVLNSVSRAPIDELLREKKMVLGYINLCELERGDPWVAKIEEKLRLEETQDGWAVDIRSQVWQKLILDEIAPMILHQGFTGFFLDQPDISIALESKFPGMKEALVSLVHSLRARYPKMKIMFNRGYEVLPQVGDVIDYELAETLYTIQEGSKFVIRPKSEYEWQLDHLYAAKKKFPHIELFSLEYWDPLDHEEIRKIYEIESTAGFRPYVATIELNVIVPYPEKK